MIILNSNIDILEDTTIKSLEIRKGVKIPDNLTDCTNLTSLSFYGSIPDSIRMLTSLTSLTVFDANDTYSIPEWVLELENLTSLKIFDSQITEISHVFRLPNLRELSVSHKNYMEQTLTVSNEIMNCKPLIYLHLLRYYHLSIPQTFWNLPLERFVYDSSEQFPTSFSSKLKFLTTLRINSRDLGDWILECKNLKQIDISFYEIVAPIKTPSCLENIEIVRCWCAKYGAFEYKNGFRKFE